MRRREIFCASRRRHTRCREVSGLGNVYKRKRKEEKGKGKEKKRREEGREEKGGGKEKRERKEEGEKKIKIMG